VTGDPVVHVPADLEIEDRLAGPVTFRMAGWLAAAAAGVTLLAEAGDRRWAAAPGLLLIAAGLAGALWRPGGRPAPAWIAPAWSYRRRQQASRDDGGEAEDADAMCGAPAVPAGAPAASVDVEPESGSTLRRSWPFAKGSRARSIRRGLTAALALAAVVAVTVTVLGRPSEWPGSSLLTGRPPADSPSPAGPTAPRPATSPGPAETTSTPPASPPSPAPPESPEQPLVLVPDDPFWPGLEDGDWLWTDCGC
jgi:hypothetical protein